MCWRKQEDTLAGRGDSTGVRLVHNRGHEEELLMDRIAPCLWFDHQAEEAATFYVSVFKNSKITAITRHTTAGFETHQRPAGSVMTVEFELDGQRFTALNGGPAFTFSEAVSLQVFCDTQQDIDYYWDKLSQGGDPKAQQCGWLKDRYGLSWQVVPRITPELFKNYNSAGAQRVMDAMLRMKKMNIAELERAAAEGPVGRRS
jgi:predicted 3-demethylubiquinone-9 3-methyltransferase (glyoxalase superfamily)